MDITNPKHFIDALQQQGFTLVLSEPFHSSEWGYDEMFYVLFHAGLKTLVWFDTFEGDRINAAEWHCCWIPLRYSDEVPICCSSAYENNHFVLTGVWKSWSMTTLNLLKKSGTLVSGWREDQFMFHLCHYEDTEQARKINNDVRFSDWVVEFNKPHIERLKRLPSHVWEALK